ASLVSTSVFAGEVTVSGGASINFENYTGIAKNSTKSFSMGNQLTFSGSGELDNGMTVGISFVLDQGDDTAIASGPFDSHSVSVSSDALGTLVFHGEGGDSAQNAVGDTAAGNIWDNFDTRVTGAATLSESRAGNNMMHYTLPTMVEDLTVAISYTPATGEDESDNAFGITYAGVEGLSVSYGQGSSDGQAVGSGGTTANADTTSMKASYAIGSFTLAYSDHDHDSNTATSDQTATSWKVSYTVSDAVSVSYGSDSIDSAGTADTSDAEYTKLVASHTSGGMTVSANYQEANEMSYTTATDEDEEYFGLSLSFAF
ncbi:porin, partial [Candidatus Pelagibacter sp.]|nr:porin [Candidatus Pelagibacter sp.]